MTPNRSTGFTPFFLAYGVEAVLPSDLDHGAPRVKAFDHDRAMEAQQDVVDLRDDHHPLRSLLANSPQVPRKEDQGRILEFGDLVLRRTQSTKENTSSLHHGKDPIR